MNKNLLSISLCSLLVAASALAGTINVVHIGSQNPLKFQVSADGASQDFTLAYGSNTGPFFLPDAPSTIKGYVESISPLEIPAAEEPRIAVLAPTEDGTKWRLFQSKPTPDKWAFRIINLSSTPVSVLEGNDLLEIPAEGEKIFETKGKSTIRVNIPDSIDVKYDGSEACAVIAFVYRSGDEWKAVFIPER